jgi:putative DNA primase/helicase
MKKNDPGALAGATGADQDAAGQQLGLSTTAEKVSPVSKGTVRRKGSGRRLESETENGGRAGVALGFDDIEPWPEVVDGISLLDQLARAVRRHLVLEPAAVDAIALWIVHTHAIDAGNVSPRLAITSPEKRSGKTTLLYLLSALVARPLTTANLTAASFFRAIDAMQPTVLIDEADTFLARNEMMRGVINAGHSRATASVLRSVVDGKDGWESRRFNVWAAVAIAAIGDLPGTIEDRSVKIALRRRRADEPVERFRIDRLAEYEPLARKAARWAADHDAVLSAADPEVPAELHDRAADNWRPLLAIADAAAGEWPERGRRAAIALTRDSAEKEAPGIMLLGDLRELFAAEPSGVLFSKEIVAALAKREDRPWAEYRDGRPITKNQLAELVKKYGIPRNRTQRRGKRTDKGYRAEWFADAWARYLPAG